MGGDITSQFLRGAHLPPTLFTGLLTRAYTILLYISMRSIWENRLGSGWLTEISQDKGIGELP